MTISRNQRYERKQKEKNLIKKTVWIPIHATSEIQQIIEFCIENRDQVPFMTRSIKTGKFRKAVD